MDKTLIAGKQQISSLLEKLTLLSGEGNNFNQSRYVSGCSMSNENANNRSIDTEAILKELDCSSRPNIHSTLDFNSEDMLEIYDSLEDPKTENTDATTSSNSDTSLITNFSDFRLAPDGQGNTSDETVFQYSKSQEGLFRK